MKQLVVILGAAGASFSAVFARWSTESSVFLTFWRMLLTAVLLLPSVWHHREELKRLTVKSALLCAASGVFLSLHFLTYLKRNSYPLPLQLNCFYSLSLFYQELLA